MADTTVVSDLIRLLDEAVERQSTEGCCYAIKDALEKIVRSDHGFIEPEMMVPVEGKYARRLLHLDPQNRYVVMVMVWNTGQGTPLHDHDHLWCVECVYRGRIRVVPFDLVDQVGVAYRFTPQAPIYAGPGEAGALIPPYEYHTLENASDDPSVTIHVYGGEMTACDIFLDNGDGTYRREHRELSYTP
jgi:predicted metal-dependent enzyme (double-stranded beta helix superfamily)